MSDTCENEVKFCKEVRKHGAQSLKHCKSCGRPFLDPPGMFLEKHNQVFYCKMGNDDIFIAQMLGLG